MASSERAALQLTGDPIISKSMNESQARMLRNVHEVRFAEG